MDGLDAVSDLVQTGRFLDAARKLDKLSLNGSDRLRASVTRAELLERLGDHTESQKLANKLVASGHLHGSLRARCEFTIGQVLWETEGDTERALAHVMRAASMAEKAEDLPLLCSIQLRLMVMLADSAGPSAAAGLIPPLRHNVTRVGRPGMSAALHILIGETEAKRSLVNSARLHTEIGLRLLAAKPNIWLSAVAQNTLLATCIILSDHELAFVHGEEALRLANESGAGAMRRAALSNLGMLCHISGHPARAIELFREAEQVMPGTSERANARLDSLARLLLSSNDADAASECLDMIARHVRRPEDWQLYGNRYSLLTRAELLLQQGSLTRALESAEAALDLAARAEDDILRSTALLTKAEILVRLGRTGATRAAFEQAAESLAKHPPIVLAHYERAMGCALAARGEVDKGQTHITRAVRIYEGIRNAPGLVELSKAWRQATGGNDYARSVLSPDETRPSADVLQDVAALMMHAGRPDLIATTAVALLAATGRVNSATATATGADGATEILACYSDRSNDQGGTSRAIAVGTSRGRSVAVNVHLPRDLESCAAVNAIQRLLDVVHDLEQAHAERDERLTLWPIDDPADSDGAILGGRMRELMTHAQRIAKTTVGILITGESGTGKEILAKAIHRHSQRADKPFMPFNCTAVPREMLESQLFGHRRGAFTGADRDHPGLIRAARGGTLFLDEVGELSLDLQPKLLRFLESGEIAPLGEPGTITVDVRIIAATNRDLDQMVRDGRFREDLFYRLNIIPITIPPLRERRDEIPGLVHHFACRAAEEFQKGHIRVAEETMEQLLLYPWPGNVRQLQNEIRRAVALADPDSVISPLHLTPEIGHAVRRASNHGVVNDRELQIPVIGKLLPAVARLEREMIRRALQASDGHLETAAAALGISRKGLYLKRRRLGL